MPKETIRTRAQIPISAFKRNLVFLPITTPKKEILIYFSMGFEDIEEV